MKITKTILPQEDRLGRLLTAKDVSSQLGISLKRFYNLAEDQRPPRIILPGGSIRYPERSFWQWKEQQAAQNQIALI